MSDITFRMATDADLPTIIAMLADDEIAENRENAAVPDHYRDAFAAMAKEVFNKMLLAEFDYTMKPAPSIPLIDTTHERRDMWYLKRRGLPAMYWNLILTGRA